MPGWGHQLDTVRHLETEFAEKLPILDSARLRQGFSSQLRIETILDFLEQPKIFERNNRSHRLLSAA